MKLIYTKIHTYYYFRTKSPTILNPETEIKKIVKLTTLKHPERTVKMVPPKILPLIKMVKKEVWMLDVIFGKFLKF